MSNDKTVMVQGRLLWTSGSDMFKGKVKTDPNTRQPKLNAQGQQMIEYGFGLAVPKASMGQGGVNAEIWVALHEIAFTLYPSRQVPPTFAWKYKDGDSSVDQTGAPYSTREGYAGHIVLSCTTTIPIKYFKWDGQQNVMVSEGINAGDYVNVQVNVKAHAAMGQGKPGLYLNPYMVQLLAKGKEIINTPSGDQVFGMVAPVAPPNIIAPTQAMAPQGFAPQPQYPPQASYGAPPVGPVQPQYPQGPAPVPHYGVLPPTMQPTAPSQMMPPPVAQYAQPHQPTQYPPNPQYTQGPAQVPAMAGFPPPPR